MRIRIATRRAVAAFFAAIVAMFAAIIAHPALAQEKITLAIAARVPGADSAFLYAGAQRGFFKDEGVDVEFVFTDGTVAAAGMVAAGQADLALGGLEAVVSHVVAGTDLVTVYQYAYSPIFNVGFIAPEVGSVADLEGRDVGVISLASGAVPMLQYMLSRENLTLDDVNLVPIGMGPAALQAMSTGTVDAIAWYDSAMPLIAASGVSAREYIPQELLGEYPGQGLYGLRDHLQKRREAVTAFLRGLTRSIIAGLEDPEGTIAAYSEYVPEAKARPEAELAGWIRRASIMKLPEAAKGVYGYSQASYWNNLIDVLNEGGVVNGRPPVQNLFTTEFLEAANAAR